MLSSGVINPLGRALPIPALRKIREGRGTLGGNGASEIKSLGSPARSENPSSFYLCIHTGGTLPGFGKR